MTPEQEKAERKHCERVWFERNNGLLSRPVFVDLLLRERAAAVEAYKRSIQVEPTADEREHCEEQAEYVDALTYEQRTELFLSERAAVRAETRRETSEAFESVSDANQKLLRELADAKARIQELEGQYAAACWDRKCLHRDMDVLQEKYDAVGLAAFRHSTAKNARIQELEAALMGVTAAKQNLEYQYQTDVAAARERGRAELLSELELRTKAAREATAAYVNQSVTLRQLQSKYDADVAAAREEGLVEGYIKHAHPEFLKLQSKHEALVAAAHKVVPYLLDCADVNEFLAALAGEPAAQPAYVDAKEVKPEPIHAVCPKCGGMHIDRGEWAAKLHRSHLCEHCGNVWRPFEHFTVGVAPQPSDVEQRLARVVAAARALREAQRRYIGRDKHDVRREELGRAVGEAAAVVDAALAGEPETVNWRERFDALLRELSECRAQLRTASDAHEAAELRIVELREELAAWPEKAQEKNKP